MKRTFYIIIALLSALDSQAQREVIDTVMYRFYYSAKITVTEGYYPNDDETNVDIGKKYVYSYSRWTEEDGIRVDSVIANGGSFADRLAALQYPPGAIPEHTLKNYPEKGSLTGVVNFSKLFTYSEPMVQKEWELLDGDTTIWNYPCKKARMTFRKRTWVVWYAPDIPFSEGPWKLDGLPGMILYAEDTKHQFLFECIGMKMNLNVPMSIKKKGAIKTNPLRIEELRKLRSSNYKAFQKAIGMEPININMPKETTCLIEQHK